MRLFLLLILFFAAPGITASAQQNYSLNDDLLYRINFGSAEDVKVLLSKGADANARSRQGETALNIAMERNDAESEKMAEALVNGGANIQTADKDGNPPIITAVNYRLTPLVKLMIDKGVDIRTKASDGTSIVEYAKKHGTPEMAAYIQGLLDKQRAYTDSLRTPERFHDLVRQYTLNSCSYQYWTYFLSSRQAPERDGETKKKVDDIKSTLYKLIAQIQQYYGANSIEAMIKISNGAVKSVYDDLDAMISNSNRAENGIGREEDAKSRCEKITEKLPIQVIPVEINPVSDAQISAESATQKPTPVQLPMDPGVGKPGTAGMNMMPGGQR